MTINERYKRSKVIILSAVVLCHLCILSSCRENDEDEFTLSIGRIEVLINENSDITVHGTDGYSLTLDKPGIAECVADGKVIHVKGIGEGAVNLVVAAANGLTKTCFIVVRERTENTEFLNDNTARIEWNQDTPYSEKVGGFMFYQQQNIDALGGENEETVTYDFSDLNGLQSFYRISVSGSLMQVGDLSDGLIAVQSKDKSLTCYKADKTNLKQIKGGQLYMIFYLPNNVTVRVVTPVIE